ncbi:NUDIX hydrolase [uncultured Tateyamaria sp.]|uniref:NUDIX domain-containing protein n=1 Tax=uncultured Tateyamaria sp. TaxID=455651 RepID=UPI002627E256|nr:NUDIX hydrolase [uncultured Tateyamaria sp.]
MQTPPLRARVRTEIAGISPLDATEQDVIADALDWLDSGAEIFRLEKPATPPKHLVSYFLLVDGDHVLLVDHIKSGLWLPSGGHVEPGEHPRETVDREIVEELGIEARYASPDPQFITATTTVGSTPGHVDVSLWYVVLGDRRKPLDFDRSEFKQVRWFHRDHVPHEGCEPELGRFLAKIGAKGFT